MNRGNPCSLARSIDASAVACARGATMMPGTWIPTNRKLRAAPGPAAPTAARHLPAAEPAHHGLPVLGLLRHRRRHRRQLRARRLRRVRRHAVRQAGRPRRAADQHRERLRQGIRQPGRHGGLRPGAGHRRLPVGRGAHRRVRHGLGPLRLAGRVLLRGLRGAAPGALQRALGRAGQALLRGPAEPVGGGDRVGLHLVVQRMARTGLARADPRVPGHRHGRRADGQPLRLSELQRLRPDAAGALRLRWSPSSRRWRSSPAIRRGPAAGLRRLCAGRRWSGSGAICCVAGTRPRGRRQGLPAAIRTEAVGAREQYLEALGIEAWVRRSPALPCRRRTGLGVVAGRSAHLHALRPGRSRAPRPCSASATAQPSCWWSARRRARTRTRRASPSSVARASCSIRCCARMGSPRDTVYIANVLKCRPPGNRDPSRRKWPAACHTCGSRSSCSSRA